jgi:hypothetical protein
MPDAANPQVIGDPVTTGGREPDHAQRLGVAGACARVSAAMRGNLAGIACLIAPEI